MLTTKGTVVESLVHICVCLLCVGSPEGETRPGHVVSASCAVCRNPDCSV